MFSVSVGMNRQSGEDLRQVVGTPLQGLAHSLILETQAVGPGWASAPRWGFEIPTPGLNLDADEKSGIASSIRLHAIATGPHLSTCSRVLPRRSGSIQKLK